MKKSDVSACLTCGTGITQVSGRGRPKLYCGRACWPHPTKAEPRACQCGNRIRQDNQSGLCRECYPKQRTLGAELQRTCKTCAKPFVTTNSTQVYCARECRRSKWSAKDRPSSTARGYGPAHQRARREWQTLVEAGMDCCICRQPIDPSQSWHLDHTADRSGYRGAAHAACNLREGQRRSAMTVLADYYGIERSALVSWLEDSRPTSLSA